MPGRWHSLAAVWACQAGKDANIEKPLSHCIWEGRRAVEAARKYKVVTQMGNQGHSEEGLRLMQEWLDAGVAKYGFHGASHEYIAGRVRELLGRDVRLISCHLGGSSSMCSMRAAARALSSGVSPGTATKVPLDCSPARTSAAKAIGYALSIQ